MKNQLFLILILLSQTCFAQYKDTLLSVNGTSLFIREIGTGTPIIIVHGGPGLNHAYFLPHLNPLSKKYRLIFYDQRACGNSSGNLDSSQMTLNLFTEDIESIRQTLNLGNIAVLGHSWGALVAMKYAIKYPNHISRLFLSNSISPKAGEFETETNQRLKSRMSADDSIRRRTILASQAFKEGNVEAYAQILKLSFKFSFYNIRKFEQLDIELPVDYLAKRKLLFFMAKELSVYDLYPSLNKISCPTLIIHGAYDGIPDDLSKKMKEYIPGAELTVIQKAGHFPFIEQKKTYNQIIDRFLAEQ
ncbi:MAG: alpha/beta fold hydrolase [Chitinophagaceae bacterium]